MNKGVIYALGAALLNATVGIFSLGAFSSGTSSVNTAFYKCLLAFFTLSFVVILTPQTRKQCKAILRYSHKIIPLSLCGIFVLYYFETKAYEFTSIAVTVFILQGMSTVTTFIATYIFFNVKRLKRDWFSLFFSLLGLILLYCSSDVFFEFNIGIIFASIAGIGYGLFLVLNKKLSPPIQGVPLLWSLLLYGSLFLFVPFYFDKPSLPNMNSWFYIASLGMLGTIGGFYCTLQALATLSAPKVQLYELFEPIFATFLALFIFNQGLTMPDIMGASCILIAIFIINTKSFQFNKKSVTGVST